MAYARPLKSSVPCKHNINYENTKLAFNQELPFVLIDKNLQTKVFLRKHDVDNAIKLIKKDQKHYEQYFKEKFQVVNENGKDILCQVTTSVTDQNVIYVQKIKQIVSVEDLFDIMFELHMKTPFLDETEVLDHLSNCVLDNSFITLFWRSCQICNMMKTVNIHFRMVGEMTIFTLDAPDGEFTDIFMYVERNTNFVFLKPIKSLSNIELAYELFTIFSDFFSPTYLASNGSCINFKDNKVLNLLKSMEPPFRVPAMYASRRTHKIDTTVKRATKLLQEWMKETMSTNWAIGAHVVQWQMNTSKVLDNYIRSRLVNGPIQSPYHAIFGLLPHTDIVKIKHLTKSEEKKLGSDTTSKEKVLVDCSLCHLPIFKVFKCTFCQRLCHFSCCVRKVRETQTTLVFVNKCITCVNRCVNEEHILST